MNKEQNLTFLYNKNEPISTRISSAMDCLLNNQISPETLLNWLLGSFISDNNFQTSEPSWRLLNTLLHNEKIQNYKFSFYLKMASIVEIYKSDFHDLCFNTLDLIMKNFPNSWRPKYLPLIEPISECLKYKIYKKDISVLMNVLLEHSDLISSSDVIFKPTAEVLMKLLFENIEELDKEQTFKFLAATTCIPFLLRKTTNDLNNKTTKQIVDIFNQYQTAAYQFIGVFINAYYSQVELLNFPKNLNFPIFLINQSKSLDIAVPMLKEIYKLGVYSIEQNSKDFDLLNELSERAIREKHSGVLAQLCFIDFRVIHSRLSQILPYKEITSDELLLLILENAFKLRNLTILLEPGNLPLHVVKNSKFILKYCEYVSCLVAQQLTILLSSLIIHSDRTEESALLYWTVKSGRLTSEHIPLLADLVHDCQQNPWRFAAGVIAAKSLQLQLPPPIEMLTSEKTNPVILDCFLYENYGELPLPKFVNKDNIVDLIPTPKMREVSSFRLAFIIKNLPFLTESFKHDDLITLLQFILRKCIYAKSLENPQTIADYCLLLFHNTLFYESISIREALKIVINNLIPSSRMEITPKLQMRCSILASMPKQFLNDDKISYLIFRTLFNSCKNQENMYLLFNASEVFSKFNIVDALCNIVLNIKPSTVKHHIKSLISNCPLDATSKLLPILFSKLDELPTFEITNPHQVIAICDYYISKSEELNFSDTMFPENLDALCAQIKANHRKTINSLESIELNSDNISPIITSLPSLDGFSDDFITHLITKLNETPGIEPKVISKFSSQLQKPHLIHFLDISPPSLYPSILSKLYLTKEEFDGFESYILKAINSSPLSSYRSLCTLPITKYYTQRVLQCLYMHFTTHMTSPLTLSELCTIIYCMNQLLITCKKEASSQLLIVIELIRKLSSLFLRCVLTETPTYKQLRLLTKLFLSLSKFPSPDNFQYLIACFVSHLSINQIDDDFEQMKRRTLQSSIFPLIARCSKDQIGEISTALHESHRQVFQNLYTRFTSEAQYKGKV